MKFKDTGRDVRQLNNSLFTLKHLEHSTNVFDEHTVIALCRVQSLHKLPITGEADEATLARITGDMFGGSM
jgi:hypothetical protein